MVVQWVQLYKDKQLSGDSGTESFPLKRTGEVLELLLKMRSKNGATANAPDAIAMATPESSLTKIEVRSGSNLFKSYSGEICRKLATYRDGRLPQTLLTQAAGGTWAGNEDPSLGWQEFSFPIRFTPKNDQYGARTNSMLPAPLYDSLDLVLEYTFSVSATVGYVTGGASHVFDLYALMKTPGPDGQMKGRNIIVETKKQDWTTTASGDQPIKLTLDKNRFLRQLMVQCYENGIGEGIDITDLMLKVNNDPVWASKWGALQAMNANDCSLQYWLEVYMKCQTTTDELWTRIPSPIPYMIAGTAPTISPYFTTLAAGDKVTITTDAANDVNVVGLSSNVLPACAVMDFDKDCSFQNMQWCGVNDLELVITNGGAGGAVQVIEQHVARPWGYKD